MQKEKVKVVIILEASAGGTRRHVNILLDNISRKKFEPILYCSTSRDKNFLADIRKFRKNSIKVRIFPMKREISPISDLWCLMKITLALRSDKPHVVHTHSSKAGFIGRLAAKFANCPATMHTPHVFPFEMMIPWLQQATYAALEKAAAKWTSILLAVSNSEKISAIQTCGFPEDRVRVVHNGIEIHKWLPDKAKRAKIRKNNQFTNKTFVVGMLGRLDIQKGCLVFIEAARMILEKHTNFRFVIAGSGPMQMAAKKIVDKYSLSEYFRFSEHTENPEYIYNSLDCLAIPSLWEACPYTAIEAMAIGIPVIASETGGIPEIIQHHKSGLLVQPRDPAKLANAILKLKNKPTLAKKITLNARKRVSSKFDAQKSIEKIQIIYSKLRETQPQENSVPVRVRHYRKFGASSRKTL